MLNQVMQAIHDRRSIRAYTDEQVTAEQLDMILKAGLAAPSARNSQPWHFTAVQNVALIERINQLFCKEAVQRLSPEIIAQIQNDDYSVFHHAKTVVFISCPSLTEMQYAQTDVGIAIQNMALAAHSLGLGSVILGMPRMAFLSEEADSLRSALAFPKGYDYCLSIAIGTPAATKEAHTIMEDRITIIEG